MPNTVPTPTWVTREVALGYLNDINFVSNINREYNDRFMISGAKVGDTVLARMPQRFVTKDGQAYQEQALFEPTVNITLSAQKHVDFGYSSAEGTTDIQDIRSRYVEPAAEALANAHDVYAFEQVYKDVYNSVGTPGTAVTSNSDYLDAGVKLTDGATPMKGRCAVLSPSAMADIVASNLTLFNPSATISEQYRSGQFGRMALGIGDWYQSPNAPVFTTGEATSASSPRVKGANQTGTSLITDGWGSGATNLNEGDVFTVAGVNAVNPLSYQDTGALQQFVLTADVSDSTGDATLSISPPIITSGQLQTVTASPANNAVITLWSMSDGGTLSETTTRTSLVFHKDFATTVMADLIRPGGNTKATFVRGKKWNLSIRMVEDYNILTDQNPSRLDILIGAATLQARLACRVQGV